MRKACDTIFAFLLYYCVNFQLHQFPMFPRVRKNGVREKSKRGSIAAASNEGIGEEPSVSLSAGQTSFRESTSISGRAPLLFSHVREGG